MDTSGRTEARRKPRFCYHGHMVVQAANLLREYPDCHLEYGSQDALGVDFKLHPDKPVARATWKRETYCVVADTVEAAVLKLHEWLKQREIELKPVKPVKGQIAKIPSPYVSFRDRDNDVLKS